MGCLTRIGCLGGLVVGGAAAWWLYGDRVPSEWVKTAQRAKHLVLTEPSTAPDSTRGRSRETPSGAPRPVGTTGSSWVPLALGVEDAAASAEAHAKLAGLAKRSGPAYATFTTKELAELLALPITRSLPATASRADIALRGDQLLIRAEVDRRDFAGNGTIGALIGTALGGRDTIQLTGSLESQRPGLVLFRIRALQFRGLSLPSQLIPVVVDVVRRHAPSAVQQRAATALPDDALALVISPAVADVRVHNDRLTLYRAVP
jgi:hypothetical protein